MPVLDRRVVVIELGDCEYPFGQQGATAPIAGVTNRVSVRELQSILLLEVAELLYHLDAGKACGHPHARPHLASPAGRLGTILRTDVAERLRFEEQCDVRCHGTLVRLVLQGMVL